VFLSILLNHWFSPWGCTALIHDNFVSKLYSGSPKSGKTNSSHNYVSLSLKFVLEFESIAISHNKVKENLLNPFQTDCTYTFHVWVCVIC